MAVLLLHAGVPGLDGGYVGVDVFYVLSGFLITGLLLREAERTGGIDFLDFYARRLRRLAPVYLLVLACTLAAMTLLLGPLYRVQFAADLAGAAFYVANIVLSTKEGGYFAVGDPSPVLHFWSLAVEEQFYLVWPLVILLVLRTGSGDLRRRVARVMAAVVLVSFLLAVILTPSWPTTSFYLLHTRAWELGVGALLACFPLLGTRLDERSRTVLVVVGAVAVLAGVVVFDDATLFPSWPALAPVMGGALMLVAGNGQTSRLSQRLLENRPMVWLGDISYSLYLWHWPVLVLPAAIAGHELGLPANLALAGLSILAAWASHVLVEQRTARISLAGRRVLVIATSLGLSLAVVVASLASAGWARHEMGQQIAAGGIPALEDRLAKLPEAVLTRHANESVSASGAIIAPQSLTPRLEDLEDDLSELQTNGCTDNPQAATTPECWGGDPGAERVLVLVGDSHVSHWWPAIDAIGRRDHYRVLGLAQNACPLNDLAEVPMDLTAERMRSCDAFRESSIRAIQQLSPEVVVVANAVNQYQVFSPDPGGFTARWEPAMKAALESLPASSRLLYLGDSPSYNPKQSRMPIVGACLSTDAPQRCQVPPRVPEVQQVEDINRKLVTELGGRYVDLSAVLCAPNGCPMATRNHVLYRDYTHVTSATARLLQPILADELERTPAR